MNNNLVYSEELVYLIILIDRILLNIMDIIDK